jgi:hypothetical protein
MVAQNCETTKEIEEIEHNLKGLTMGIPYPHIDDLPCQYQCHTIGVSGRIAHLLWRVAHEVVCYHEHHV